jgi:hypothetical protein
MSLLDEYVHITAVRERMRHQSLMSNRQSGTARHYGRHMRRQALVSTFRACSNCSSASDGLLTSGGLEAAALHVLPYVIQ